MTITETPNDNPGPAPFDHAGRPPSRWTWPIMIALASLVFCVAAGLAACEVDEAADAIDAEEIDSQDDAAVRSCDYDGSTGAATATISVTNDSSGPSTYVIEIEFIDGDGTVVGHADTVLDEVAPAATEERHVDEDVTDGSDVTCRIGHVERFAA